MKTLKMLLAPTVLLISNLAMANSSPITPVDCTLNGTEYRVELNKDEYGNGWGDLTEEGTEVYRTFRVQRIYGSLIPGIVIRAFNEEEDESNAFVFAIHDIENGRELGLISKGDKIVCRF